MNVSTRAFEGIKRGKTNKNRYRTFLTETEIPEGGRIQKQLILFVEYPTGNKNRAGANFDNCSFLKIYRDKSLYNSVELWKFSTV